MPLPQHHPNHLTKQPDPTPGKKPVLPYLLRDLIDRAQTTSQKYGTHLETDNGRQALVDAYQEALDLCMYLKQALMEMEVEPPSQLVFGIPLAEMEGVSDRVIPRK